MIQRRLAVLFAALSLLFAGTGRAFAGASSATVNIEVTITGSVSVSVDAAPSSTQTTTWNTAVSNQELVSLASATVTNDSGGLTEKWALSSNAKSINTLGNPEQWTLQTSTSPALPGPDQFALQAVFGSTNTAASGCPAVGDAAWQDGSAKPLTATPVVYTSAVFAAPSLAIGGAKSAPDVSSGANDGRMHAGSKRALCWRIIAPQSTSTTDAQNIQITVTAVAP